MPTQPIDVVLPVHNEGESIAFVLREFYETTQKAGHSVRMIACEDGSTDNTVEQIREASATVPVFLITGQARKGYSRAVIDGFKASESELVGFIDSDGQCDPADFDRLYKELQSSGADLIVGYRNPRRDHWIRILMSRLFGIVYGFYFDIPLRDPSCPYLLIRRASLLRILEGNAGILQQGFWWEFFARAFAEDLNIRQVPVSHRDRVAGETVVYRPTKVPKIAWSHLRGLGLLRAELRQRRLARKSLAQA